jgi:hypothetical protein
MNDHLLILEASYPIRWLQIDEDLMHFPEESFLPALMALEQGEKEQEHSPLGRELSRIEAKVNLALLLLGDLRREKVLPPYKPALLSAKELIWQEETPPVAGEKVTIEIYLNPHYPYPLRLSLQVIRIGEHHWVSGQWVDLDPLLQEQFTQYIFRAHRRALARRKIPG